MTNHTLQKNLFQRSCTLIGIAVILGAFGAHGLKKLVPDSDIITFKTGVQYQFIHAFSILILALSLRRFNENAARLAYRLFVAGIILFSGSLYVLVFLRALHVDGNLDLIGLLTPLGGLCFITAWFYLAYNGYKKPERHD